MKGEIIKASERGPNEVNAISYGGPFKSESQSDDSVAEQMTTVRLARSYYPLRANIKKFKSTGLLAGGMRCRKARKKGEAKQMDEGGRGERGKGRMINGRVKERRRERGRMREMENERVE